MHGIFWYIMVYFGILLGDLLLCFDVAVAHWYTSWRSASLLFIVYELLVSLAAAIALEADSVIKEQIGLAQGLTVISWCTYPVVCPFRLATAHTTSSPNVALNPGLPVHVHQVQQGRVFSILACLSLMNAGPGGVGRRRAACCAPLLRSVPRD